MVSLQEFIGQELHLNDNTTIKVLRSVWPALELDQGIRRWEHYITYFKRQCHRALHDHGRHTLIRSFEDIAVITDLLAQNNTREELACKVKLQLRLSKPCGQDVIDNTLDLVARLCSMVNIETIRRTDCVNARQTSIHWQAHSLQTYLSDYFDQKQELDCSKVRLDRHFTASNMRKIAGFKIKMTDSLADHLRIIDERGIIVVVVFSDVSFLKQPNWWVQSPSRIGLLHLGIY